jgi:hypothetical protein
VTSSSAHCDEEEEGGGCEGWGRVLSVVVRVRVVTEGLVKREEKHLQT